MPSKNVTREALYSEVWSRPMVQVAKDYGLSDRGLAKLCSRHEIPVPPRGYWAKVAHGHKVVKPPLPPLSGPSARIIEIAPTPEPAEPTGPPESPEIERERDPNNRITVAANGGRHHPFVQKTREALARSKPGDRGLLYPSGSCLDVCVSPTQVSRALRLMDALVRALEARGYSPRLADKGRGFFVTVLDEPLSIGLDEKAKRAPRKPTEFEQWALDNGHRRSDPYDLAPSGVLSLRIGNDWWRPNHLTDGKRLRLEDSLNVFIVRLIKAALREKDLRAQQERAKRQQEEWERRRREEEERQREEDKRVAQWDEWMAAWNRSQQIRAFATAIQTTFAPIDASSRVGDWLTWATDYADRIDPLRAPRATAGRNPPVNKSPKK